MSHENPTDDNWEWETPEERQPRRLDKETVSTSLDRMKESSRSLQEKIADLKGELQQLNA